MHVIKTKKDCLDHIESLYGRPNITETGNEIWLDAIATFGVGNLPYDFLKVVAAKMLRHHGEAYVFMQFEQV